MMMALDEGNLAPPPAPAARLPKLPRNAEIVCPRNADVSLLILRAVLSQGALPWWYHLPQRCSSSVGELACHHWPSFWHVPGMGPYASPEKYEGEGLHYHRAIFLIRAGARCSAPYTSI